MRFLSIILTLIFTLSSGAKEFSNRYLQFTLPNGWECNAEGSDWVCQSLNPQRKKEAIIIMTAKIAGEQDGLRQYQKYLKKPKTFTIPGGQGQTSDPRVTAVKSYNGKQWVDALHLASEVPGFYTRYLATVKADLAVAITFSVAKDHYLSYKELFDSIVSTLKVFRQAQVQSSGMLAKGSQVDGGRLPEIVDVDAAPDPVDIGDPNRKKRGSGSGEDDSFLIILLVIAVGGFIALKKLKKKPAPKRKKKKKKTAA